MNYSALFKGLISEAKTRKQYEAIPMPYRALAFIGVLPFILSALINLLFYIVFDFIFNGLASSTRYLENWVDEKKKGVNHATEAVLFFVTMPTIFFFNVLLSGFALLYYFIWFFLQVDLFVATLGGTRWQPYISNAKFDDEDDYVVKTNGAAAIIFSVASFSLVALAIILAIFDYPVAIYGSLLTMIAVPLIFKKGKAEAAESNTPNEENEN